MKLTLDVTIEQGMRVIKALKEDNAPVMNLRSESVNTPVATDYTLLDLRELLMKSYERQQRANDKGCSVEETVETAMRTIIMKINKIIDVDVSGFEVSAHDIDKRRSIIVNTLVTLTNAKLIDGYYDIRDILATFK